MSDFNYVPIYLFMVKAYAQLGVTRTEFLCLVHLASHRYGTTNIKAIAKEMGYSGPTMVTQLIRSLEKKGMLMVERSPDSPDLYNAKPFFDAALSAAVESDKS